MFRSHNINKIISIRKVIYFEKCGLIPSRPFSNEKISKKFYQRFKEAFKRKGKGT